MQSRDTETTHKKAPRFIQLAIEKIHVPRSTFKWMDEGNFYPMAVPSVKKQTLDLLQLLQPIVVVPSGKETTGNSKREMPVYTLIAGRRSLQLIAEQVPRQTKILVICIEENPTDAKSYEVMDFICSILLRRPDDETKTLLASALLEDKEFLGEASNFLDVSTTEKVASMLGISRATLHRITTTPRRIMATRTNSPEDIKTTLGIIGNIESENKI